MNDELRYFLTEGPRTVKDLARLTELSTSTLYKQLKEADGVQSKESKVGKVFWIDPEAVSKTLPVGSEEVPAETPAPDADQVQIASKEAKAETRGRKATGAGKKLYPLPDVISLGNPRRVGTHGHKSMQIIIDNPGILTEDYLSKGGRLNDLRWDIERGRVELK